MNQRSVYFPVCLILSLFLPGCGIGSLFGMRVQAHEVVTNPPSQVNVIVTVQDGHAPVPDLGESNFEIYEDGLLLDKNEIRLRLVAKDELTSALTVLLLDLSGDPSATELKRMQRGASHFVEKVSVTQPVFVVAFDGSQRPREVARFSKVERATEREVPDLAPFLSGDNSRDLYSAMMSSIKGIDAYFSKDEKEVHFGTVVTLLRGPDLAGRTGEREVRQAIYESGYEYFSLSPEDRKIDQVSLIGNTETFAYATMDTLPMRLSDLGMYVRSVYRSHYLLRYCSPARAGEKKLKVAVSMEGSDGGAKKGSAKSSFDASGFEGGCSAEDPAEGGVSASPEDSLEEAKPDPNPTSTHPTPASPNRPSSEKSEADPGIVAPPDNGKYE